MATQIHLNCLWNFLRLAYHHSHFLPATLDFTSFFLTAFLGAAHFFRAGLFWISLYYTSETATHYNVYFTGIQSLLWEAAISHYTQWWKQWVSHTLSWSIICCTYQMMIPERWLLILRWCWRVILTFKWSARLVGLICFMYYSFINAQFLTVLSCWCCFTYLCNEWSSANVN